MDTTACTILAEAFRYPEPGRMEALEEGLAQMPAGPARKAFAAFVEPIRRMSLGEWEELHTRTLELNPPAAPYVGFQTWGESYQRGQFLAQMNRELMMHGIDTGGELPDHLTPVLRYLGSAAAREAPLPALVEVLDPAFERMRAALRKVDPENPYLEAMAAAQIVCKGFTEVTK